MITFSKLGQAGRIGNQMFQIASTIGIAKENNTDFVFPKWEYEKQFNLHNCFSNTINITRTYEEPFYHYKPVNISQPGTTDLSGYFQSYKYFEQCIAYIMFIFESIYRERPNDYTSIHVRRTDYVELGGAYYTELARGDYYERAMSVLNSDKYLIFSDDIEWCKSKFVGSKFEFIDEPDPAKSMMFMSACSNNIIANSSFSWWAAYLNKNPEKKVIAPAKWFGPKLPHNIKDLIPTSWNLI